MAVNLDYLDHNSRITKNHLRDLLKAEAKNIHMEDIMLASSFLREDAKYMPASYRQEYIERFSRAFFNRIKDIKEDKNNYISDVDTKSVKEFLKVINKQNNDADGKNERCFVKIAKIISAYTTFVCEEPIHPLGTKFPGGFILYIENDIYYCPVKKNQMNNPSALCKFCVSVQDESR
jgi:uncharacterized protein (UPF0305 family)